MHLSQIALFLLAAPAFIMASPVPETNKSVSTQANTPPNGWNDTGECNGTSCNMSGNLIPNNVACTKGSCGGPEGGDGKICGYADNGDVHTIYCPGGY